MYSQLHLVKVAFRMKRAKKPVREKYKQTNAIKCRPGKNARAKDGFCVRVL